MKKFIQNMIAILMMSGAGTCFALEDLSSVVEGLPQQRLYDVTLQNPCFPTDSGVKEFCVPNGSMLDFASSGIIGKTIRAASALNAVPNPLGLTHSGIVVNEDPRYIYEMTLRLTPSSENRGIDCRLSEKAGKAIMRELLDFHADVISLTSQSEQIVRAFTLESDGTAAEVLKGIAPHVHIHDLTRSLKEYSGNIYLRPLISGVDSAFSRAFLEGYLGRPYESITALKELLRSVSGTNKKERLENVFCSELAACFYKGAGKIPQLVNSSNVTPEMFSTYAGERDLLLGIAGPEIALKRKYDFSAEDLNGTSCWGGLTKRFLGCCL